MIVAIDGTSGSGKSTIAKLLSEILSFELLNTGLIYRKITKECLDRNIQVSNKKEILDLIQVLSFENIKNENLHTENISKMVPYYAREEEIRIFVRKIQREIAFSKNIIVEGRDISSVVFPDAEIKLFIDATIEERTKRRMKQLGLTGDKEYQEVLENLQRRDNHDESRDNSPLIKAKDAIVIDTTNRTIADVLKEILEKIA